MCNVSAGRVSQWISEGKISGAAIVGEGRGAGIDVELAREQLKLRLSTDERFGLNGLSTTLEPPAPSPARVIPAGEAVGTVEEQLKAEKLKQAEFLTSRLELEDRARHGIYVDAQEAAGEMTRIADDMLKIFEGAFPEFASALAAKFQIPQREALHLLRDEFRRIRKQLSAAYAAQAAQEPKTIDEQ
jgi:hypothetical protein